MNATKKTTKGDEVIWSIRLDKQTAAHVEAQVRVSRLKKSEVLRDAVTLYMHLCTLGYDFKHSTAIRALHEQVDARLQARGQATPAPRVGEVLD